MNDQRIPVHQPAPSYIPQHTDAESMAQNRDIQHPAGASDAPYSSVQVDKPAPAPSAPQPAMQAPAVSLKPVVEDTSAYTVSVDDVRARLRELHITKSKDTIQRYCREGDLDCRKLGMLNRYYTTATSLEKLIATMHPTDAPGASSQVHAGVETGMPVHEGAGAEDTQKTPDLHEGAEDQVRVHAGENAGADTSLQVHAGANAPSAEVLQAKLEAANERIEDLKKQNEFLQEEVKESRGNRSDVTAIAQKMLGTLESMALGGRLTEPARSKPTPASMREASSPQHPEEGSRV